MKRGKARERERERNGWLLLGNDDMLKDDKEEEMRRTRADMK